MYKVTIKKSIQDQIDKELYGTGVLGTLIIIPNILIFFKPTDFKPSIFSKEKNVYIPRIYTTENIT